MKPVVCGRGETLRISQRKVYHGEVLVLPPRLVCVELESRLDPVVSVYLRWAHIGRLWLVDGIYARIGAKWRLD